MPDFTLAFHLMTSFFSAPFPMMCLILILIASWAGRR